MEKIVLITGSTSGIGEATAHLLAEKKYHLILCGRRNDRLAKLKDSLKTEVHTLSFDVRIREDVEAALSSLPEKWKKIDVLVNNAGNAHGLAPIQNGDVEDWEAMIDINVKGLLFVSREVIPGMVERKSGHIINIGSIAGKEVYPKGNVYCASKFAVDAISSGMRIDLNEAGVKVTEINPGLVDTEFSLVRFKGDQDKAGNVYQGITPLYGKDIAEAILWVIDRPEHVQIAEITIFPKAQASSTLVHRKQ
jgi:NADP-dependent 3-hydroxy acid dehydrogenase YdfG